LTTIKIGGHVPNVVKGFVTVVVASLLGVVVAYLGGAGQHELMHVLQARVFRPLYLPIFALNYAVNFINQVLFTATIGLLLWLVEARSTPYLRPPSQSAVAGFFGWIYYETYSSSGHMLPGTRYRKFSPTRVLRTSAETLRIGLCALVVLISTACSSSGPPASPVPRTIEPTRVVRIAATTEITNPAGGPVDPAKLALSLGSTDELPEGPNGFDVAPDGSYLITDPLRRRIAVFDRNGQYRSEWQIGFAADSVTIAAGNLVQVRDARTGEFRLFDLQGKPAGGNPSSTDVGEARLAGPNTGVITWAPATAGRGRTLEVQFEKTGTRLLSLQPLAIASSGDGYVAVESTTGGDAVNLTKSVRRYSPEGKLIAETTDLPLDYFVRPTDELRVKDGVVYQLMTTMSEVRINVWDMK
jgi:hypothetical protein